MARAPKRKPVQRERVVPTDEELDAQLAAEDDDLDDETVEASAGPEVETTDQSDPDPTEADATVTGGADDDDADDDDAAPDSDDDARAAEFEPYDPGSDDSAVSDGSGTDDPDPDENTDEPEAAPAARPSGRRSRRRPAAGSTPQPVAARSFAERLYTGELGLDFNRLRKPFYIVSAVLMIASIALVLLGRISPGIDFRGGADFQVTTTVANTDQTVQQYADAVEASGVADLGEVTVRTIGDDRVRVQTRTLNPTTEVPAVQAAIANEAQVEPAEVAYSLIGASWGGQITQKALLALGVFLALVSIVIAIYFRNWKMSIAALIALVHDLVLTVGVYAAVGFTVTPATVIGVLTILGYSLYDTVVVFDKVRENTANLYAQTNRSYAEAANLAVNQVLVRSINTTIIGVLPVGALLFAGAVILGEGPLKDLALALFVGMIAGAYSSIFIATPLLVQMKNREPDIIKHNKRVAQRHGRAVTGPDDDTQATTRRRKGGVAGDDDELAAAEAEVAAMDDLEAGGDDPVAGPIRGGSGATPPRRVTETSAGGAGRPQPRRRPRSGRRG